MNFPEELQRELDLIKARGLYRAPRLVESSQGPRIEIAGREYICACSNNYLGLASHPAVKEAACEAIARYGWGGGASRLISGTMRPHAELEETIAGFKGTEAAIVFPSGYMANVGVISALVGLEDTVIVDKLDHASIIDGCRLSGARMRVYPHGNMNRLEDILKASGGFRRRLIVTDGIFSMDGDLAPLREIVNLARRYGAWLMVDEAHATGVLGADGRGVAELLNVEDGVDISMGTLSKALGGSGGYVAGPAALIDLLRNSARSFIYTTAPPPAVCAVGIAAIGVVTRSPELKKALLAKSDRLRRGLNGLGFDTMRGSYHIIPLLVGEADAAAAFSSRLFQKNVLAPAIRPPTVPRGTSRLRLTLMATHSDADIDCLLSACAEVAGEI
jgi:8-amino-7-oxononanoate synthase